MNHIKNRIKNRYFLALITLVISSKAHQVTIENDTDYRGVELREPKRAIAPNSRITVTTKEPRLTIAVPPYGDITIDASIPNTKLSQYKHNIDYIKASYQETQRLKAEEAARASRDSY